MSYTITNKISKFLNVKLSALCFVSLAFSDVARAQDVAKLNNLANKAAFKAKDTLLNELYLSVEGLKHPQIWRNVIKIPIKVTTHSEKARIYTRQGFGLMQGQWDIEAHRSFVYALKHDKKCIGAYIGLLMMSGSNHNPSHSMHLDLIAKVDKLKSKKLDGEYRYSLQERLYADLFLAIAEADRGGRLDAMDKLVEESPMDFQARIMKNILLPLRKEGNTLEKQSLYLSQMMERYPYTPVLWMYWLAVHQYDDDQEYVEKKLLPVAEKLVKWAPKMPGWHMRYGSVLARSGKYKEAEEAFDKSTALFMEWGESNRIPASANAGFWQSRIYKAISYYRAGEFDKAMELALAMQQESPDLMFRSEVRGIYLWEVQTLPARLYLARNEKGDLVKARKSLPDRKFSDAVQHLSAASMYYTGFRQYIAFRIAVEDGKIEEAKDIKLLLDETNLRFQETAKSVSTFMDKNYFYRGKIAVTIYLSYCNSELDRIAGNKENQTTFLNYAKDLLNKHASLSMLPRHVIEDYDMP